MKSGKKERYERTEYKNGMQQGAENKQIEIAKKMLDKGAEIDYIIEITGLSKEEIEKL